MPLGPLAPQVPQVLWPSREIVVPLVCPATPDPLAPVAALVLLVPLDPQEMWE